MGDIRTKHKKFRKPRKSFDKVRIEEENVLVKRYGLKNKRELWKADMAIKKIRDRAKKLITADEEEKMLFIDSLRKKGFSVKSMEDILGLDKEDLLKRRLQSMLVTKNLATKARKARQLVVHKHVLVSGKKVNIPSYHINVEEESQITVSLKPKPIESMAKPKKEKPAEEVGGKKDE